MKNKIFHVLAFIFFICNAFESGATTKNWVGTTSSWKKASNWSPSGVPGSGDIAVFASGSAACSIDTATVNVAGFQMNTGYTGTVTQSAANTSFTVGSSNAAFGAGTFVGNAVGGTTMTMNGTFTLSGTTFTSTSGSLIFISTFTYSSGTFTHHSGTVTFNGTNSQVVPALNYYNLSITGSYNIKFVTFSSGTIGIANTFTNTASFTSGGFIITGNKVDYNGTAAQVITAFSYNDLTSSSSGTRSISGIVKIKGKFVKGTNTYSTTGSTIDYNGTGGQTIIAFAYYNLTLSGTSKTVNDTLASSGVIIIANTFTNTSTFSSGGYIITGSSVNYTGTGAQTVVAFNYNNLTISSVRTTNNVTLANSGTIGIAGIFTNSATFSPTYGFVNTGSTINYNGSGSQTIIAFNYMNLTSSSSGARTLASTNYVRIAGTFTKGTNTYTNTNSTIEFNGTGPQTVPAFAYYNLIISGSRTAYDVTFDNSASITIAKIFNPLATFTLGGYITTGTTIDFNGTLPSVMQAFPYDNLTSSSSGPRAFTTSGTAKITGTFTKGTNTYTNIGANGQSFAPLYSGISTNFSSCSAVSATTAYVAGNAGIIEKTTNSGASWTIQATGITADLRVISFYDANNGLAAGYLGLVLRTTDGGATWTSATVASISTQAISGIYYLSSSVVFMSVGNGSIIKSTDGGVTWGSLLSISSYGLYGIFFTSSTVGYVVGNGGVIYKTTNAGTSWSAQTSNIPSNYVLTSVCFTDANHGYAVGGEGVTYSGVMATTADGGTTWVRTNYSRYLSAVDFTDANNGFAVGGDVNNDVGYIMRTSDAGASWTMVHSGSMRLSGMSLINHGIGYMCGLDGTLIKYTCCTDGGTVEFAGSSSQTIPSLDYNSLTFSSTGARVLASSGNIGISRNFTRGTNSMTTTGSTVVINGLLKQTFSDKPVLNNITVAGTSNDTVFIPTSDTLTAAGTFTYQGTKACVFNNSAMVIKGDANITNSATTGFDGDATFLFSGTSNQAIASTSAEGAGAVPNVLIDKTGGTITFTGNLSVRGDWTYVKGTCVSSGLVDLLGTFNLDGQGTSATMAFKDVTFYALGTRTLTGNLTLTGSLKINHPATLSAASYYMLIGGSYTNIGTFIPGTSKVEMNGTGRQFIISNTAVTFNSLIVNKASGKVQLDKQLIITDSVKLVKGVIVTTPTNNLQFSDNAVVKNTSDTSYVAGPVNKEGDDVFVFPLGDTTLATGAYHPLSITAPGTATDLFTGQYFASNQGYGATLQTDSLESISDCEYWLLTRAAGTSVVTPTLGWNTNSCNIENYDDIVVAGWNSTGSIWNTMGRSTVIVNGSIGSVKALSAIAASGTAFPLLIGIARRSEKYAVLKRELDGSFYTAINGKLNFKYDEEYNDVDGKLTFNIYDNHHTVVLTNSLMPVGIQPGVVFGDNRYFINTLSCSLSASGRLPTGYYLLEVVNEKNEKRYLRFYNYYNVTLVPCH